MSIADRETKLALLRSSLEKPGGAQAMRFALAALGAVPLVGGAIGGAGALWAEREQSFANGHLLDWAALADSQINELVSMLEKLLSGPSRASMSILFGELVGDGPATSLISGEIAELAVILNPSSVAELEPYIANRWVTIRSTGSMSNMGAGNRSGNHIEELKRPYGMGSGFILSVTDLGRAT